MATEPTHVYLVGVSHVEGNSVKSIHASEAGAMVAWKAEKDQLIAEAQEAAGEPDMWSVEFYRAEGARLLEIQPYNNGGILDTPYVKKMEVLP